MNLDEAIKVGLSVPSTCWADCSPVDQYEEAARVLAEYVQQRLQKATPPNTWVP